MEENTDFSQDDEIGYKDELSFDGESFEGLPNPVQELQEDKKHSIESSIGMKSTETEPNNGKITVEIGNVQKLTADLAFSAQQIENAADKIEANHNIQQILSFLSNLKSPDFENELSKINDKIEKAVEKIDVSKLQKQLEKQIETNLGSITKAADKFQKYAETFADEEINNTFDQIEKFEKFLKNFKFRSIVFASVIAVSVSLIASLFVGYQVIDYKVEQKFKASANPILYFFKSIKQGDIIVAEGDGVVQLQLKTSTIKLMTAPNGMQYLQRLAK